MHTKHLLSLAAAQAAWAQSLTDVLMAQNSTLSTLIGLVQQQPGLLTTLGGLSDITILAPSNEAFAKLLADPAVAARAQNEPGFVAALLTYHVLNGTFYASDFMAATSPVSVPTLLTDTAYTTVSGGQRVIAQFDNGAVVVTTGEQDQAKVVATNFNFTGGTAHVLDTVLTIPTNLTSTLVAADLTALAGAATKANLVKTLTDVPQLTLFAPNNAAFDAIKDVAAGLSVEELTAVLGYHAIAGAVVYSDDIVDGAKVKTVQGSDVTLTIRDGSVYVNGAKVVKANVLVKNGVVHVIDGVLIPGQTTATPSTTSPTSTASGTPPVVTAGAASMNTAVLGMVLFGGLAAFVNM